VDLSTYFDRVVVLSLSRRPERLKHLFDNLAAECWPFAWPEVVTAVDGTLLPIPSTWRSGAGAYGCRQGHLRILEDAWTSRVERLLVLEDDAILVPGFSVRVADFLTAVPDDWEQLMLGAEIMGATPTEIRPGVYRVQNCQRTHAYALCMGSRFAAELYQEWSRYNYHLDWKMAEMHSRHRVYAPTNFLVGQIEGPSDIVNRTEGRRFWTRTAEDSYHSEGALQSRMRQRRTTPVPIDK